MSRAVVDCKLSSQYALSLAQLLEAVVLLHVAGAGQPTEPATSHFCGR